MIKLMGKKVIILQCKDCKYREGVDVEYGMDTYCSLLNDRIDDERTILEDCPLPDEEL